MKIDFTRHLLTTIVALSLLCGGPAWASCPSGWLDFTKQSDDGNVILTARNLSDIPITFTMYMRLRRFSPSRNTVFTESLQPRESRQVIALTRSSNSRSGEYSYTTRCTIGNNEAHHNDDVIYQLPYASGKSYRVLQSYGSRFSHTGREKYTVDFDMKPGTPVHAARGGIVALVEESNSKGCWNSDCGAYANYIVVLHDDDTTGEYYHLQKNGALVEPGQRIVAGQKIGLSGNTGHTTMPHLHFGVYRAISRGREQSIEVRYMAESGVVTRPRPGGRYLATQTQRISHNNEMESSKTF